MALQEYKCPNCSGPVSWNPGAQEIVCPYCASVINPEAISFMDDEPKQADDVGAAWDYDGSAWRDEEHPGMVVYSCNSCGGEVVGDETLGAAACPFCGSPVLISGVFTGALRPNLVIPFKLDKAFALQSLDKHYTGKKLLPTVFKSANHISETKGVYIPFWLYDADADAHIDYRGTKVRTWSDSRYVYTETSHYKIARGGSLGFLAVPADGSKKIDNTLMESLEPYNVGEAMEFNNAYLAGFYANKYDLDAKECSPRVNERIKSSTVSEFRKTVTGYTTVTQTGANIRVNCSRIHYALFPVWLLGSTWEGKSYMFAMNGQSGKFVGDLPLDKSKRWSYYWKMFGIIAASLLVLTQGYIAFFM
ncbi:MAG: hypothetical protein FWH17_06315 [Oscillospiraceae bacterium]|nr:hypothetical protein [Oscillospiraceae bacterium]